MASGFDRVLQLQVAMDVSDLNSELQGATSGMEKLGNQVAGFAKSAGISALVTGVDLVVTKTSEGFATTQALTTQTDLLAASLAAIGDESDAVDVLDEVSEKARALGFDEVEAATAFNTILNQAGSAEEALAGLDAAMDLTRSQDELTDLAAGAELVRDVFAGDVTASVDDFGATMDEAAAPIDNVVNGFERYNTAAEDFAGTTAGMTATLNETVNQGFAELGAVINELALVVLPVLINDVLPALGAAWEKLQPAVSAIVDLFSALWDLIKALEPLWGPLVAILGGAVLDAFNDMVVVLELVTKAITAITDAIKGITAAINGVVAGVKAAMDRLADAILGPLGPVKNAIDNIGSAIGNILGRSGALANEYNAAASQGGGSFIDNINPFSRSGLHINVTGDERSVEAGVLNALRRYNASTGAVPRNRLGARLP